MNQKLIRGWSGVFSASMLMVLGCGPLATGSESTVETEAAPEAQARGELVVAEPSAPEQAAAAQEMATYEDEAQALGAGPASLTVPGLTILHGGQYADTGDPDWTLDTGNGAQQTVTRYIKFPVGSFSSTPAVTVTLSHFNMLANRANAYINIGPTDVTVSGFNLKFYSAGDAVIYSATARWIAFGRN